MEDKETNKKIIDYFKSNIFEAFSSYNGWKMICHSRSDGVVSKEMAEKYTEIQKYHPEFFVMAERNFLISFVMLSLHSFDKRDDSFSLYKIEKEKTENFVNQNNDVLEKLKTLRHKLFAHRDINMPLDQFIIPSVDDLDNFFEKLMKFYNELSYGVSNSTVIFDNSLEIKRDIELMFQNLYRGEAMRRLEIDIEWMWEKDEKKASNII